MDGSGELPKGKTLHSWKEIANCLGVTVRSVQRWEQSAGLPVYRQGTGSKARVFAYSDELIAWRQRRSEQNTEPDIEETAEPVAGDNPAASAPPQPRRLGYSLFLALALLAIAGGALGWRSGFFARKRVPVDWILERSTLKVLDAGAQVLWEKRFPALSKSIAVEPNDKVLIEDIDNDGRKEVLFNHIPDDPAAMGGSLMCFEPDGRLRWETPYGAPKTIAGRTFSRSYKGRLLRRVTVDGKPRVLAVSNHYLWYPAQVAILDPATGRMIEDYWHPGVVYHCFVRDLDKDGKDEVVLGAINNPGTGLGHAAVAVLKLPLSSAPRGEIEAGNRFPPMLAGGESGYVLFPVPDVSKVMGVLPIISHMAIDQHDRIVVEISIPEGGAVYYLDFRLSRLECRFSDAWEPLHNRLHKQGLLDHSLTDREREALSRVVPFPAAPDGNHPELEALWKF